MSETKKCECPPHKISGTECCVAHFEDGVLQAACFRCSHCGHFIRPEKYEDDCERCAAMENLEGGLCEKGHAFTETDAAGYGLCQTCKAWIRYVNGIICWKSMNA